MSAPSAIALTERLILLGQRLRTLRLGRDWTLERLSRSTGCSKAHLSRLEAGDRQASLAVLLRLAEIYDVPLETLFQPSLVASVLPGLVSLNLGQLRPIGASRRAPLSGIAKIPTRTAVRLRADGLEGDDQADRSRHGGPERAVCVYPLEHYPYWSELLSKDMGAAAFGENFSVWGMTEETVCIGDVYRVGSATVQVSQPRGYCDKLGLRYNAPKLEDWMRVSGYTGFYCRVLENGQVRPGEPLRRLERLRDAPTVSEVNRGINRQQNNHGATGAFGDSSG